MLIWKIKFFSVFCEGMSLLFGTKSWLELRVSLSFLVLLLLLACFFSLVVCQSVLFVNRKWYDIHSVSFHLWVILICLNFGIFLDPLYYTSWYCFKNLFPWILCCELWNYPACDVSAVVVPTKEKKINIVILLFSRKKWALANVAKSHQCQILDFFEVGEKPKTAGLGHPPSNFAIFFFINTYLG